MPIIENLIADQFGSHIGKYSGRLKITKAKETLAQAPLIHLRTVTVAGNGVSISADAIRACTEKGIPIHFLSGTGRPYAQLYSAGLTGTIVTRRAQLAAYQDARALHVGAALAAAKIENQAAFIKYAAKYRKETDPDLHRELRWLADDVRDHLEELHTWIDIAIRTQAHINDLRAELLSIEGRAAQAYWRAVRHLLPDGFDWPGRRGRGATDPLNSALNYGYGILYSRVHQALTLAGLDPYGGFIHADRPGKPSLVHDLIEPFRVPAVDRPIVGLVNRGTSIDLNEHGYLTERIRKTLAAKIIGRLEKREKVNGERHRLRHILQQNARSLATYLRGEHDEFEPFEAKW